MNGRAGGILDTSTHNPSYVSIYLLRRFLIFQQKTLYRSQAFGLCNISSI